MSLTIRPGALHGTVAAPASKSHTHRAFILAALCGNGSVRGALQSADTQATLDCLQAMGFLVSQYAHEVRVGGHLRAPRAMLDAKESGTTLRLMTGVASLLDSDVRLTGAPRLLERPMVPLLHALGSLGVRSSFDGKAWTVHGPQSGGHATLPGAASSQFVSSILLSAPLARKETHLAIEGEQASRPYVDITLAQLRHHGVRVNVEADGYTIPGGQSVRQRPYNVPGDYSSAAFLLAAAAIGGGDVTVRNLSEDDPQGDRAIVGFLQEFGANVRAGAHEVRLDGGAKLHGVDLDVGATPDLFPVLCAVGAVAEGTTILRGAPHLRHKESDRIHAMATNLAAAGIQAKERPDGIEIQGGIPKGILVQSFNDHRIAMACAAMALGAQGASNLPDENVLTKSYPNFHIDLQTLAAQVARQ